MSHVCDLSGLRVASVIQRLLLSLNFICLHHFNGGSLQEYRFLVADFDFGSLLISCVEVNPLHSVKSFLPG